MDAKDRLKEKVYRIKGGKIISYNYVEYIYQAWHRRVSGSGGFFSDDGDGGNITLPRPNAFSYDSFFIKKRLIIKNPKYKKEKRPKFPRSLFWREPREFTSANIWEVSDEALYQACFGRDARELGFQFDTQEEAVLFLLPYLEDHISDETRKKYFTGVVKTEEEAEILLAKYHADLAKEIERKAKSDRYTEERRAAYMAESKKRNAERASLGHEIKTLK